VDARDRLHGLAPMGWPSSIVRIWSTDRKSGTARNSTVCSRVSSGQSYVSFGFFRRDLRRPEPGERGTPLTTLGFLISTAANVSCIPRLCGGHSRIFVLHGAKLCFNSTPPTLSQKNATVTNGHPQKEWLWGGGGQFCKMTPNVLYGLCLAPRERGTPAREEVAEEGDVLPAPAEL